MAHDWKRWFEGYANDWAAGEVEAVADRYAPVFMTANPTKSATYDNGPGMLKWLRGVRAFHLESGLERVEVVTVRDVPIGEHHTLVSVTWAVRFTNTGSQRIQFEISYLLGGAPTWRILTLVSHEDQRSVMRRYGLL
ncbi:MAG: hypothetical protein ABMB14_18910 [Myxococcota bacterium]